MDARECISLKTLAVSGSNLIALGIKPGKEIGMVLQEMLEIVLEDETLNTKEALLSKVNIQEYLP